MSGPYVATLLMDTYSNVVQSEGLQLRMETYIRGEPAVSYR